MLRPTNLRVLYVEDDDDSRDMVTFMLAQENIEVVHAKTVTDAWQMATSQPFDLYLLDGQLLAGSSLNLCRDLHSFAPFTPILFYSALAYQADIASGMAAGANGYLVKPYFGDLCATVLKTVRDAQRVQGREDNFPGDFEDVTIFDQSIPIQLPGAVFARRPLPKGA